MSGSAGVHQQGAGGVFDAIEEKLKKYDEREKLLANTYQASETERKKREEREKARREEREKARREGDGTITSNAGPSASNAGPSASNAGPSASNAGPSASNAEGSDQDTKDDPQSCYIEIKKLVLIENSVILKKALEEWDRKEKLFASRVERKSTKVESRKNEVYQLIGFFSVFQGVVLTAVSQSNLLHCNNWWSPVLLSLLASVVTIGGVSQKLMQISSLEQTIYSEEQALKDVVHRGQELRREGKDFEFAKFSQCKKKESKEGYATWYAVGVLSFLVVFTVVFPLSHWRILCYPGRSPYGSAPPPA